MMEGNNPPRGSVVALPLRLASEPYAKDCISPSCVSLGIPASANHEGSSSSSSSRLEDIDGSARQLLDLSALADDDGIRAFGLGRWVSSRKILLEHLEGAVQSARQRAVASPSVITVAAPPGVPNAWKTEPLFVLVRSSPLSNAMRWCVFPAGEDQAREVADGDAERGRSIVREHFRKKASQTPSHCSPPPVSNGTGLLRDNSNDSSSSSSSNNDASFAAELIVHSIRHYYSQQILEPSVKGFLGILEKQFARSDLYLFELLQNAVDDGASVVRFQRREARCGGTESLVVAHNGRSFTPLDVVGLSSVGLSTKSRQGKRTIGFMGVGFKAVYKRYARVTIDDGTYRFAYEEPSPSRSNQHSNNSISTGVGGYGWVMLPQWQPTSLAPLGGDDSHNGQGWCRFSLERPRGGRGKILQDLAVLPPTAPPLLGRAHLIKTQGDARVTHANSTDNGNGNDNSKGKGNDHHQQSWVLDWNGTRFTVRRSRIVRYDRSNSSELVTVELDDENANSQIEGQNKPWHWLFVSHTYRPSESATTTYQTHTKRKHTGSEEVCGFVRLGEENVPLVEKTKRGAKCDASATRAPIDGLVHSVLPTTIRMPFPMNLQGSWLLSVDRQQVQDLTDNAWNGDILEHAPELVASFFRWAAHNKLDNASQYHALSALLPPASTLSVVDGGDSRPPKRSVGNTKRLSATLLGQSVSLDALERAFWSERILPVGMCPVKKDNEGTEGSSSTEVEDLDTRSSRPQNSNGDSNSDPTAIPTAPPALTTAYDEGEKSIWVPPSWFRFLPADFLRRWLGKRPLRTDLLGSIGAYHPFLALETVVGQLGTSTGNKSSAPLLFQRARQLQDELGLPRKNPRESSELSEEATWMVIRIMAAIVSSYDEHPHIHPILPNDDVKQKANANHKKKRRKPTTGDETVENDQLATNQSAPSMPETMNDWPIFVTQDGNLARLEEIFLPSPEFSALPTDLASLLRPYLTKHLPDKQPMSDRSIGKKQRKRSASRGRSKTIGRLHSSLEAAISFVDRSTPELWSKDYLHDPHYDPSDSDEEVQDNPDYRREVFKQASRFLHFSRRSFTSTNVVSVTEAVANFLKSCSDCRHLSERQISWVLQIGRFGLESSDPLFFPYVLVDAASTNAAPSNSLASSRMLTKLVPASQTYIGKAVDGDGPGAHLEDLAGSVLQYVSSHYNFILNTRFANKRKKLVKLLASAGVQTGISVLISMVDVGKDDRILGEVTPKLPNGKLPSVRKSTPKTDVILPYGLGVVMNRSNHYLIDSQISHEWERILTTMSPSSSLGFLSLLLSMPFENFTTVTSDTVLAAAKCLTGRGEGEKKCAPVDSVRLSEEMSTPLRRRLFFLPPGQPAANALDISASRLIEQLQSTRWLPCKVSSTHQELLTLFSPSEALLEPDRSRPEMPVVDLPAALLAKLKSSTIAKALAWGIQAPPPPLDELAELAEKAKLLFSSMNQTTNEISAVASRMFSVWNSICRYYLRDGLSQEDKKKLRNLCTSYCIPVRSVLDSGMSTNWIVQRSRCVRMPASLPTFEDEKEALKSFTVASLVASNFICDFNHSVHNPFFHEPEISKAVIELTGMQTLDNFERNSIIIACGSFVRYCCTKEPIVSSRLSSLRDSFSYALKWCLESPKELPKREDLKVWVRHGPGIGTKALPARWVSLYSGPIQPVLDDDKARSALLSPEMNIQLIGILDHSENEKDSPSAKLLSVIDRQIIDQCGILRLSDRRFSVKARARGTPTLIEGASTRLQLIFALLREMDSDRHRHNTTSSTLGNIYLDNTYIPFLIIRHDSLIREFQAPGMIKPSSIHMYAMFGRSPKFSKARCILVRGGSEDYSIDLEELVLDHVGICSTSPMVHMKPCRSAVRLLSHIENDISFLKFVERDFADYEATKAWKVLMERKQILRDLSKAENSKDRVALRKLLIRAEELFENDSDAGDKALESARDLLPILEKEAEEKSKRQRYQLEEIKKAADSSHNNDSSAELGLGRGKTRTLPAWVTSTKEALNVNDDTAANDNNTPGLKGRGRGVSNLPAWMTSDSVIGASKSMDEITPNKESKMVVEKLNDSKFADADNDFEKFVYGPGIGQGRGSCNLPSFMTSNKVDNITSTKTISTFDNATPIDSPVHGLGRGRGRGRGINNLPAWMTSTGSKECLNAPCTDDDFTAAATEQKAKSIVSAVMTDEVSIDSEGGQQMTAFIGRGRGRGISNVPAWMTKKEYYNSEDVEPVTQTTHKRKRSESLVTGIKDSPISDEEQQKKMLRLTEGTSKLMLTLDIEVPASQEPDFCAWLQQQLEQDLSNRGGSMKSIIRHHDSK